MYLKSIIQLFCYFIIPGILIFSAPFLPTNVFIAYGHLSLLLIVCLLYIKPLSVITTYSIFKNALKFRRPFGVLAFWFFVFHVGGMIYHYSLLQDSTIFTYAPIFYGFLGGIGMVILGLTSNKISVRYLKKNWKKVQFVAYPTLYLGLIHAATISGNYIGLIVFGGGYIVLKFLEIRKKRNSKVSSTSLN